LLGVDHFQQSEIAGHEVDKLKPGIIVNKDGGVLVADLGKCFFCLAEEA
jgi:hypothetical protein